MAELTDLGRIHSMMFWDQNTMMPPNGAAARADHSAHARGDHATTS